MGAQSPAVKIKDKAPSGLSVIEQKINSIKSKIEQRLKNLFPSGKAPQPGAVDDDAVRRMYDRQKLLEKQLKEVSG